MSLRKKVINATEQVAALGVPFVFTDEGVDNLSKIRAYVSAINKCGLYKFSVALKDGRPVVYLRYNRDRIIERMSKMKTFSIVTLATIEPEEVAKSVEACNKIGADGKTYLLSQNAELDPVVYCLPSVVVESVFSLCIGMKIDDALGAIAYAYHTNKAIDAFANENII